MTTWAAFLEGPQLWPDPMTSERLESSRRPHQTPIDLAPPTLRVPISMLHTLYLPTGR